MPQSCHALYVEGEGDGTPILTPAVALDIGG